MAHPACPPRLDPFGPYLHVPEQPDVLKLFRPALLSWTDWGQSVFKVERRCIVTIRFWVGIHTHPRYSSSPPHICMAIYSGSTSPFDPCQAHSVWATTPSGQFCLYWIRFHPFTIRLVIHHQSPIFVAW